MTNLTLFDFINPGGAKSIYPIFNDIIVFLIALAFLFVVWGAVKMVLHADNEQARTEGRQVMIWGVVGVFIMVSVWGLVFVIVNTFGTAQEEPPYEVQIR